MGGVFLSACLVMFYFTINEWVTLKKIAGSNPMFAVTYPKDEKYGLISDSIVIVKEVTDDANPFLIDK